MLICFWCLVTKLGISDSFAIIQNLSTQKDIFSKLLLFLFQHIFCFFLNVANIFMDVFDPVAFETSQYKLKLCCDIFTTSVLFIHMIKSPPNFFNLSINTLPIFNTQCKFRINERCFPRCALFIYEIIVRTFGIYYTLHIDMYNMICVLVNSVTISSRNCCSFEKIHQNYRYKKRDIQGTIKPNIQQGVCWKRKFVLIFPLCSLFQRKLKTVCRKSVYTNPCSSGAFT